MTKLTRVFWEVTEDDRLESNGNRGRSGVRWRTFRLSKVPKPTRGIAYPEGSSIVGQAAMPVAVVVAPLSTP